jgi:hypothetical protein
MSRVRLKPAETLRVCHQGKAKALNFPPLTTAMAFGAAEKPKTGCWKMSAWKGEGLDLVTETRLDVLNQVDTELRMKATSIRDVSRRGQARLQSEFRSRSDR